MRGSKYCKKIASLGQSLGGAASLLGDRPLPMDAYIIESVFPSIEHAVHNRLEIRMGMLAQIPLRLDISLDKLRPMNAVARIHAPIVVAAGSEDRRTKADESRMLFDRAGEPKTFLLIDGAAHVDLYRYAPEKYRQAILVFLSKHLE